MGLNKIKSDGSWGNAAADINQNFDTIGADMTKVKNATLKNKGYFATAEDLRSAYPSANVGDYAYVGSVAPYQTWQWKNNAWSKLNDDGGGVNVDLNNYYPKSEIDPKLTDLASEVGELASYVNLKEIFVGSTSIYGKRTQFLLKKGISYYVGVKSEKAIYNGDASLDRMIELRAAKTSSTEQIMYFSKSESGKNISYRKKYTPNEDVWINIYLFVTDSTSVELSVFESTLYDELNSKIGENSKLIKDSNSKINVSLLSVEGLNIDTTNKVIDLGSDPILCIGDMSYSLAQIHSDKTAFRSIKYYEESNDSGSNRIIFDVSSKTLYAKNYNHKLADNEVLIGSVTSQYLTHNYINASFPFKYTVDGKGLWEKDIENLNLLLSKNSFSPRQDISVKVAYLESNISYVIEIDSTTGINEYTGPDSGALWIEMRHGGKIIYSLPRTSDFKKAVIYYKPTTSDYILMNPSRYGENEKLDVVLYTQEQYNSIIRTGEQNFTSEQKEQIRKNLDIYADGYSIESLNTDGVYRIITATTKMGHYGQNGKNKYISLLVMSDSHADWERVNRCFDFSDSEYVDCVIHGGDIVESSGQYSQYDWKKKVLSCQKPVLAIVGNHEMQHINNPASSYKAMSDEEVFNLLYNDELVNHNGEIHPQGKNYYYKDVNKNGYTIRIIALYQYEWNSPLDENGNIIYGDGNGKDIVLYSQEQVDWFVETLKSTPIGVGIVLLTHSLISNAKYEDSEFNEPQLRGQITEPSVMSSRASNKYFFAEIIKAYIDGGECTVSSNQQTPDGQQNQISVDTSFDGGGKVVVNICGHTHSGGIMRLVDSGNNIIDCRVVMSPCTTAQDGQNTGWWGRNLEGKLQDNLNVVIYDNDLDKVKVVRVGATINHNLKDAKSYVF